MADPAPTPATDDPLTAEDKARLTALRERITAGELNEGGYPNKCDRGRLRFARWLVERGKLSEDCEPYLAKETEDDAHGQPEAAD